jgi:peptidoglycan-associated lipoprotein
MDRYFSKFAIALLLCLVFVAVGCSTKKTDVDPAAQEQEQVEQTEQETADQEAKAKAEAEEERLKAEELARQKKEAQQKKEAKAQFENKKIYFSFDSSELSEEARQTLENKAEWMRSNPDSEISVEGHCDERGTAEYNLALGERRAESAKKYLNALGIESDRIDTISYGEEKPAVEGSGEEVWSQNRRAEFNIISE